jgi:hypothetical protein
MDVDGCFEPSQAACLSLNAKGNHHDPVMPMTLGHGKLTKADLWRNVRMIWMQHAIACSNNKAVMALIEDCD